MLTPVTDTQKNLACFHCGDTCPPEPITHDHKTFCCEGCKMVYEILNQHGLCTYYDLEKHPGITLKPGKIQDRFAYLDLPEVAQRIWDYADEQKIKVTFFLPGMHCASCIWLLENLHKLHPGVVSSRVNFLRKEIYLTYFREKISLRQLVELLASVGYEPEISLDHLEKKNTSPGNKSFFYKLGIAGFAFGNIMLLSFPEYLGLSWELDTQWGRLFGYLQWVLALPVFFYSSSVFFQSAWLGLRQKNLNIDVPIALGILALFIRSTYDIFFLDAAGYLDSLAGLIFFLLSGRWFQQKTYDSLSFDRDYKAYFPVAATKISDGKEQKVMLSELQAGDRIVVRNQELIPADARLLSGETQVDYSFVTGESVPVKAKAGDLIYAGGRQAGVSAEMILLKNVSQSYLTQLWNQEAFQTDGKTRMDNLTDRFGKKFTVVILLIAAIAAGYWLVNDASKAAEVFTAVLIIACPCALAMTGPITFGNTLRILGRWKCYLKNSRVIESLAGITHVVFDKTGTITRTGDMAVRWENGNLTEKQQSWVRSLVRHSVHPVSQALYVSLRGNDRLPVSHWEEITGQGISGEVAGVHVRVGSWIYVTGENSRLDTAGTYISIGEEVVGNIRLGHRYRDGLKDLVNDLRPMPISLITGDNDREIAGLEDILGKNTKMAFRQSPEDKLKFIQQLQQTGARVMMLGDGLNDAGALRQADAGVAVSENINHFSPACDAILDAENFRRIPQILAYARTSLRLAKAGIVISLLYNVVGLSFAVQGLLSPVVAAILMPLSSVSVIGFGLISTHLVSRKYR
ncbi:MAG: heavy metal translocating P-type ATPase metal-binding domain-containing protein [Bacteroidia bacterium]|nr:heavy metal translocating P-type ATPase metal-binding domain-containing protein [Bacteroidia bacterium]